MRRDWLRSSYSHPGERLSLDLGNNIENGAGDNASAKKTNKQTNKKTKKNTTQQSMCQIYSFHPKPGVLFQVKPWNLSLPVGYRLLPSFLPSSSIHKCCKIPTPHVVRIFRRKTDQASSKSIPF